MQQHASTQQATCNGTDLTFQLSLELLPAGIAGRPLGELSVFSYVVDAPPQEQESRPVLFLTNGGPGSASAFLHLSGIGPYRAAVPHDLALGALPPYRIEISETSILDVADLVFLDAPRTGLGRIADDADPRGVYSVEGDAEMFAEAITTWVRRHQRWNSPKYFLGESYGTHRAAFLSSAVHGYGTAPLHGIALLGQAVNIQEVAERPGNVVGALANVPFKAATAWFHKKGSTEYPTVEAATEAALDFAWGDLSRAMLKGTCIDEDDLERTAAKLAVMIGIPAEELRRSRLWISKGEFRSRLLRDEGLTLGSSDARYAAPAVDASVGEQPFDASATRLLPQYAAAMDLFLDDVLGVRERGPYIAADPEAVRNWTWDESGSAMFLKMGKPSPFHSYPYAARLSRWMKQVPTARLFIGTGIYDSLTTVGAADHLTRQWDLPSERVTSRWYRAGHMMYSDADVAADLNADLRAFVTGAEV
ncbi:S10 family serine carboxypeptidase-like protein [Streptomyces shenzhenensis]|uniref:S10 family serine carboxypeptidase-like protein n=1 Tax=Streptomyces shenzhenensis TaxID=943815 RepID=UPI003D8D2587